MAQVTGIFDYFVFVDETTGKTESVLQSDLSNEANSFFFCDMVGQPFYTTMWLISLLCNTLVSNFLFCLMVMKATKDCDYWQTASFDTGSNTLYYQVRVMCLIQTLSSSSS